MGYRVVKKAYNMFSRFNTACDGRTDRGTDGRTDGRPAYSYYVRHYTL